MVEGVEHRDRKSPTIIEEAMEYRRKGEFFARYRITISHLSRATFLPPFEVAV